MSPPKHSVLSISCSFSESANFYVCFLIFNCLSCSPVKKKVLQRGRENSQLLRPQLDYVEDPYPLLFSNTWSSFFFLPHLPSSPFTSFNMGSSLTSAVFIHPCASGAGTCLPISSLDLVLSTTCQPYSTKRVPITVTRHHLLISLAFPTFSSKVKHNSCKQGLFKEEELC